MAQSRPGNLRRMGSPLYTFAIGTSGDNTDLDEGC